MVSREVEILETSVIFHFSCLMFAPSLEHHIPKLKLMIMQPYSSGKWKDMLIFVNILSSLSLSLHLSQRLKRAYVLF